MYVYKTHSLAYALGRGSPPRERITPNVTLLLLVTPFTGTKKAWLLLLKSWQFQSIDIYLFLSSSAQTGFCLCIYACYNKIIAPVRMQLMLHQVTVDPLIN
jgi:hypothetical protein